MLCHWDEGHRKGDGRACVACVASVWKPCRLKGKKWLSHGRTTAWAELLRNNLIQGQNSVIKLTKSFCLFHIVNQERIRLESLINLKGERNCSILTTHQKYYLKSGDWRFVAVQWPSHLEWMRTSTRMQTLKRANLSTISSVILQFSTGDEKEHQIN